MNSSTRSRAAKPPVLNPSTVLATFTRADAGQPTQVRAYLQEWHGRVLFHLRYFTKAKAADSWHPTVRGATVRPDDLAALEAAIVEARRILAAEGGTDSARGDS